MAQEQINYSEQEQIRRDKLAALRESGNDPYLLTKADVDTKSSQIRDDYDAYEGKTVTLAGRIMARNIMGKASFARLLDTDGNMLEPFGFVNGLIRSAKQRIVLIDNYVDETILLRLAERSRGVKARICTQQTSPSLNVALAQHNKQYEPIDLCIFTKSHDRFLIIDNDVYHIGASIKDLGKRWFAFCKMQLQADEMITKLI